MNNKTRLLIFLKREIDTIFENAMLDDNISYEDVVEQVNSRIMLEQIDKPIPELIKEK